MTKSAVEKYNITIKSHNKEQRERNGKSGRAADVGYAFQTRYLSRNKLISPDSPRTISAEPDGFPTVDLIRISYDEL